MEPTVPIPGLNAYIADEVDAFRATLDVGCRDRFLGFQSTDFDHAAFDCGSGEVYDMMVKMRCEQLRNENRRLNTELNELRLCVELQHQCGV